MTVQSPLLFTTQKSRKTLVSNQTDDKRILGQNFVPIVKCISRMMRAFKRWLYLSFKQYKYIEHFLKNCIIKLNSQKIKWTWGNISLLSVIVVLSLFFSLFLVGAWSKIIFTNRIASKMYICSTRCIYAVRDVFTLLVVIMQTIKFLMWLILYIQ